MITPTTRPRASRRAPRRGVAAMEAAIVLPVALLILFAGLDVAMAIQRRTLLSECACRAGRLAIVSGQYSRTSLGPTTWSGTAADSHPVANAIRPLLVTLQPASVGIVVEWPEGERQAGKRLQVRLTTRAPTIVSRLFGLEWVLTATSTMLIAN